VKDQAGVSTNSIKLMLKGAPLYMAISPGVQLGRCIASAPVAVPQAKKAVEIPAGAVDIKLFEEGTEWTFLKNTGDGSFTLGKDDSGKPIGILQYDFTGSTTKSVPYVLASAPVNIAEGAIKMSINARSSIPMRMTFRVVDSTGQTHQYKGRITGTAQWETILIPLNTRLEHWDGANDGKIHFPIQSIVFSLPLPPGEEYKNR